MSDVICSVDLDEPSMLPQYVPLMTDRFEEWILPKEKDGDLVMEVARGEVFVLSCHGSWFNHSGLEDPIRAT